ncbi:MAG: hypothetical protein RLW61_14215 [Gammaproteobacteria bacterium]
MEHQEHSMRNARNPWKIGVIATAVALVLLVAGGLTFAALNGTLAPESDENVADTASKQPASKGVESAPNNAEAVTQPAAAPREDCSRYLASAQRDTTRVAKDGAIGAMVGAGTGAAGGAIADGGSGAGKGAGIGAIVGAVAGAAHGFTKENDRVSAAERAYAECLARNDR